MGNKKILLLGGGGHCNSVLDSVLSLDRYDEIGIIDNQIPDICVSSEDPAYRVAGVVGTDSDMPALMKDGWNEAFITVGSVGDTRTRRRLYRMLKELGLTVPAIIDPTAVIATGAVIREGTFIGKRAVVNAGTVIGECCIVNSGAVVEHGCAIGTFAHIGPGAILCGQVQIGKDVHVGAGAVIRQGISIGANALIGIGSAVVKDIPSGVKAYGNPCRVVE